MAHFFYLADFFSSTDKQLRETRIATSTAMKYCDILKAMKVCYGGHAPGTCSGDMLWGHAQGAFYEDML